MIFFILYDVKDNVFITEYVSNERVFLLLLVFYICSSVGELYFKMEKLKNFAGSNQQSLAGFEKIRTVGKGNFLIHDLK